MRLRTYDKPGSVRVYNFPFRRRTNGGAWQSLSNPSNRWPSHGESWTMDDVADSGYFRRRAKGEVIINPLVQFRETRDAFGVRNWADARYSRSSPSNPWVEAERTEYFIDSDYLQSGAGFLSHSYRHVDRLNNFNLHHPNFRIFDVNSIESSLLADSVANATSSTAQALVTMAELGKTFDLFFDSAKRMGKLANWLETTDLSTLRKLARDPRVKKSLRNPKKLLRLGGKALVGAASEWLQYRYGFMATYYDLKSWVDAKSHRMRASGVARTTSTYTKTEVTYPFENEWTKVTRTKSWSRFTRSSAGVLLNVTDLGPNPGHAYGANHWFTAAWELIPFSFVADWFLDIGTRIQALEGSRILPILGTWIVHRHQLLHIDTESASSKVNVVGNTKYERHGLDDFGRMFNIDLVIRKANPAVSAIPELNVKLNWRRIVDGVALMSVITPRVKKALARL